LRTFGTAKTYYVSPGATSVAITVDDHRPFSFADVLRQTKSAYPPYAPAAMQKRYIAASKPLSLFEPFRTIGFGYTLRLVKNSDGEVEAAATDEAKMGSLVLALAEAKAELSRLREGAFAQSEFLRNVVDTVPGFVCVKAENGRFVMANKGMAVAYGTTTDDIVGKSDFDFNPDHAEVQKFGEDDHDVIANRRAKYIPAEKFTTREGVERWIQTTKVPLFERDGSCRHLLAVALDITERRKLESDLSNAQKLQAIGRLAGGIAHDFNNALTVILGACDTLQPALRGLPNAIQDDCRMIAQSAQNAARLTSELLAFSRNAPLRKVVVDLHQTIARASSMLARTIDRSIRIETNFSSEPSYALIDESSVQSALLNLGLNARDAMPGGGVIRLSTTSLFLTELDCREAGFEFLPGLYHEISVIDSGCGMDEATKARVFEPFFTTKAQGQGTGLGLSSVYGTIRSHGGNVRVYSDPGHGSVFKVYLPAQMQPTAVEHEVPPAPSPPIESRPLRVLLVDDEPLVRRQTRRTLVRHGHLVTEATDGAHAIDLVECQSFDVVILDMVMPKLGGDMAFERIRILAPGARVIIASGFSPEGRVEALLQKGAAAFLQKPYREWELVAALVASM